jgi:hypothetical protein
MIFYLRHRRDAFFSYTETSLEISIVAEVDSVEEDFKPVLNNPQNKLIIEPDVLRVLEIDATVGMGT